VLADVAMLRFEVPVPEIVVALKVAVAPAGRPVTVNPTGVTKPFTALIVNANGPGVCPCIAVRETGVAETAKSGAAVTTKVTGTL